MNKNKITIIITLCISTFCLISCQTSKESVAIVNGTNAGFILGQNPLTFSPEVRLGYSEYGIAFVRDSYAENELINVAVDVQYRKNSADGRSRGLFQRLAVGAIAVQQPFINEASFKGNDDLSLYETKAPAKKSRLQDDLDYEYPDEN